jgi:alanine racemase
MLRGFVSHGDFVRVGLTLLGGEPLDHGTTRLEPILTWRTTIARLKEIPEGHPVGYGTTFKASRSSRIATLPVGYADGYSRLLSNRGEVLVHGVRAPVVGRVSMDLVTIDVTGIELASPGDPVVLLGRQGNEEIPAEEIAAKSGTIPYEVFTSISERVPRVYRTGNDIVVRSKYHPQIERRTG